MSLKKSQFFSFKGNSTEAVRKSISQVWHSCLPARTIVTKSPYILPDFNKLAVKTNRHKGFLTKHFQKLKRTNRDINATPDSESSNSGESNEQPPSTSVIVISEDELETEPQPKRIRFKEVEVIDLEEKREEEQNAQIRQIMDDFNRRLDRVMEEVKSNTKRQKKLEKEMAALHARADNIEKAVDQTIEKFESTIIEIDKIINSEKKNGKKRKKKSMNCRDEVAMNDLPKCQKNLGIFVPTDIPDNLADIL